MAGGTGDGNTPTSAKFLSGMLGSLPPFEELFKMAGLELPDYLIGSKKDEAVNKSADDMENNDITDVEPEEEIKE